jgi:hypothetical protein
MNRRQGLVIEAWKKLDLKLKEGEKAEQEWIKVARDSQDVLDKVQSISSQFYPIIAGMKTRNAEDILAHLEERSDGIGKHSFLLEKLNSVSNKVGDFLSGRISQSEDQKVSAEKLSLRLKETQNTFQVTYLINQINVELLSKVY